MSIPHIRTPYVHRYTHARELKQTRPLRAEHANVVLYIHITMYIFVHSTCTNACAEGATRV